MRRFLQNLLLLFSTILLLVLSQSAQAEELNVYVDRSDPVIAVSGTKLDGNRLTVTGSAYDAVIRKRFRLTKACSMSRT